MACAPNFASLPNELKISIFSYIKLKEEQAAVCLVSRECRKIMAPQLWFSLDLTPTTMSTAKTMALLDPDNRILHHVRRILVYHGPRDSLRCHSQEFESAIQLIITALPRDTLLSFCTYMNFDPGLLLNLLRHQRTLDRLEIPTRLSDRNPSIDFQVSTHASWVSAALRELRRLQVHVGTVDCAHENCAYLLRNSPKLRQLSIMPEEPLGLTRRYDEASLGSSKGCDAFGGPFADSVVVQPLQLTHLQLRVDLKLPRPETILAYVNFSGLRSLSIDACGHVGPFLAALAAQFSQNCNLIGLEIGLRGFEITPDEDVRLIEDVLMSCSSLQRLWIGTGQARTVNTSYIVRHGSTLRKLGLSFNPEGSTYYSAQDLSLVLSSAPHLEQLAVYISPIEMGSAQSLGTDFTLTIPSSYNVPNALEAFLVGS